MKSGATMLITVGFLLVFVRHITNAKDSPMCDFNMDMAKQKHRRMNAKKEIVIYIVFLSGQSNMCAICAFPCSTSFFTCNIHALTAAQRSKSALICCGKHGFGI